MPNQKTIKREGTGVDYEQVWYCLRLCAAETFPDGRPVPPQRWKSFKPIWIKLGEGVSWAKAITFGPTKQVTEEAAEDFGAERIVWLDKKNPNTFSETSQDSRSDKKRGVI